MNYTGRQLREISFPLGGIGTGSIGLSGSGRLIDWEIFNHANKGSTCSHVWNYAYALCFLFPELERTIRDLEFAYNTYETGEMDFRLKLPLGRRKGKFRACVDGQMGSIIKTFREWKLSGDTDWLRKNWPVLRNILFYAWSPENEDRWDRNRDGVLEGRQHHTLDMELFGPSSWLEGFGKGIPAAMNGRHGSGKEKRRNKNGTKSRAGRCKDAGSSGSAPVGQAFVG